MSERTATFETEHGPKTYEADELQSYINPPLGVTWVSRDSEATHIVAEPREGFVRKLHKLYCREPGDETVGEIRKAIPCLTVYH